MMKSLKSLTLSVLPAAMLFSQSMYGQFSSQAVFPSSVLPDGFMRPHVWMATSNPAALVHGPGQSGASCNANGCYYFPADVRTAYATGSIPNANGGAGMTIGIVDAFYNPQTAADLATFSTQFGLPACPLNTCLTIVNQTGGAPSAALDSGWGLETNLDVQWVHAIAPNAKILLVTATNNSNVNLFAAEQYAMAHANVVSNSWGGGEFAGQTGTSDSILGASTVPILFSSGDTGAQIEFPCSSTKVTCVGGTNMTETATSFRNLESAWGGSGGGCSTQEAQPNYQAGFSDSACTTHRGVPDIAGLAAPNTGVLVFLGSNVCSGTAGDGNQPPEPSCTPNLFYLIGGTSLACPLSAAYIANVDTARAAVSKQPLGSNLKQLIYAGATPTLYHYRLWDVTTGSSGFPALAGWDRATGLGVPLGPAMSVFLVSTP